MAAFRVLLLAVICGAATADHSRASARGANPIRKVVTLMQNMQKEIEAEGVKEEELFDKFMCFCQGNSGELAKVVADLKAKIPTLQAALKGAEAGKISAEQDVIDHKKDAATAQSDLAQATTIREKEAAENAGMIAEVETNLGAVSNAIPALEKGMGAAALMQMPGGDRLGKIFDGYSFSDENERRSLEAFMETSVGDASAGDYVPASGQIVGILKTMKDEMTATLAETKDNEARAAQAFQELKASKEKEAATAIKSSKEKTMRAGELALTIVQTQDELGDSEVELAENEKFVASLEEQCKSKEAEWAERQKLRQEEITAISEAIKILNDDDALEVFKKTIPSASFMEEGVALLQRSAKPASLAKKATAILASLTHQRNMHSTQFGLMLFTLKSKLSVQQRSGSKAGKFDGIMTMIDDMVTLEGKEQKEDDDEKPWCEGEFSKSANEEASEKKEIEAIEADLGEKSDQIATLEEEIKSMVEEIAELDKMVAEASEQRKEDHADFVSETQMSGVAVELVEKAKNRMNKFYNPTVYVEPEEKDEEFFAQIRLHRRADPGAPPATFGAYEKSEGKSSGVIALMEGIIKDLKNDIQEAQFAEKTAQKDYEELMNDSQKKRVELTSGIKSREAAKADLGIKKQEAKVKEDNDEEDVLLIEKHVMDLHSDCDFILENYDSRKEARTTETESLKNAKAALAGATMR